jgi:hypothetical protein
VGQSQTADILQCDDVEIIETDDISGYVSESALKPEVIMPCGESEGTDVVQRHETRCEETPMETMHNITGMEETNEYIKCSKCNFKSSKRRTSRSSALNHLLVHYRNNHIREEWQLKTIDRKGNESYDCALCEYKSEVMYVTPGNDYHNNCNFQCRFNAKLKLVLHFITEHGDIVTSNEGYDGTVEVHNETEVCQLLEMEQERPFGEVAEKFGNQTDETPEVHLQREIIICDIDTHLNQSDGGIRIPTDPVNLNIDYGNKLSVVSAPAPEANEQLTTAELVQTKNCMNEMSNHTEEVPDCNPNQRKRMPRSTAPKQGQFKSSSGRRKMSVTIEEMEMRSSSTSERFFHCPRCEFKISSGAYHGDSLCVRTLRARNSLHTHYAKEHLQQEAISVDEYGKDGYSCSCCDLFVRVGEIKNEYHAKYFARLNLAKHYIEWHEEKKSDLSAVDMK